MVPNAMLEVARASSRDSTRARSLPFSFTCSRERYTNAWLPIEPATTTTAADWPVGHDSARTPSPAVSTLTGSESRYG